MRSTFRLLMLSTVLLGAPLAMAQAQTSATDTTGTMGMTNTTSDTGARPGNDIGTRSSLPRSPTASNIVAGDTRSTIAPTPPEPPVGSDANVQQLLTAANQAIVTGQTGMANEALERAESNILTRSVLATQVNYASQDPVVSQIEQARFAIGNHDKAGAQQMINQILASNAPELSD